MELRFRFRLAYRRLLAYLAPETSKIQRNDGVDGSAMPRGSRKVAVTAGESPNAGNWR